MSTAALPFPDFDEIISEYEINLFMKRHGYGHIGEKIP